MIKSFKIFESYGLNDFQVGDRVTCKKTLKTGNTSRSVCVFKKGREYSVTGYSIKDDTYYVNTEQGRNFIFDLKYMEEYFTKDPLERKFNPDDPYGEEEWEENNESLKTNDDLIKKIQSVLTNDLLIPYWQKHKQPDDHPQFGHCYAASEALFHMLGGKAAGYTPMRASTELGTHWWIRDKKGNILDPTAEQFTHKGIELPYDRGIGSGFLTKEPSKRAREIIKRVHSLNESLEVDPYGEEKWEDEDIYVGDIVTCVNNTDYDYILKLGKNYEVEEFDYDPNGNSYIKVKDIDNPRLLRGIMWDEFRFKKKRINEKFFLSSRDNFIYYTQTGVDNDKVNKLMRIITPEWIRKNPVAFETYKGKLYLTEGHHRFEAALRLNDKKLIETILDTALYYPVKREPRKMKKRYIPEEIKMIKENTQNKMEVALDFISQTIKGTEWEGKVYMAGGGVRDEIMGNPPKDIDLLINAPDGGILFAEWITKHLGIYKEDTNPVIYPRFGTAKFNLRKQKHKGVDLSKVEIECVMPRKEKYVEGSRKPEVSAGTLKDDVDRRDFTTNSLLKDLTTGEILDLTGMGKDDIKRGIVRTPLDPDVIFSDDPLRMLRAIRFTVKYNWDLPMFMIRALKRNAKKLEFISSERIQDELNKMLLTGNPDKAIRLLQITKLSKYIFPELDKLIKLKQNKFHKYDAMRHTLEVLKNTPPDIVTRLAALFHDIGKAKTQEIIDNEIHFYKHEEIGSHMARDIMKRLRYPREIIDAVAIAIEGHMRTKQTGDEGTITDRSLRKLKQDLGPHLEQTLDLIHADNVSHADSANMPNQVSNIRRRFVQLEEKDKNAPKKSPLSGDDVMEILGIKKGPIVGKILKILGDMYLEDPTMSKEELTHIVKKSYEELK